MQWILSVMLLVSAAGAVLAQDNRIDTQLPDAPQLAAPGPYEIGVRTLEIIQADRPNVLSGPGARHDRPLTLEVWYPADLGEQPTGGAYEDVHLANSSQTVTLHGQAVRDAAPLRSGAPYPLVIVSHGFPGNRFLLSHFGENLASKGYVVVAIDHFESTYDNQRGFASTLANRSSEQLFVLDSVARSSAAPDGFLAGLADAERSGIIGYSMGGYGALLSAGAGLSPAVQSLGLAPPEALADLLAGSEAFVASRDSRLKAVVAIAPWGAQLGLWDAGALADVRLPVLLMGGTLDEVSGYEPGIRRVFEGLSRAERVLLSFQGAGHNAAAPIPAPREALAQGGPGSPYEHYADFVWSSARMNNVAQHFVTAFFDLHLKGEAGMRRYLALEATDWREPAGDRSWPGFTPRTTRGLVLEYGAPQ